MLCPFPLQQPRAGATREREREAKWAQKVLESLRTAAPKGQFGGRGVERFISLGQMEGASEREVQR